MRRTSLLGMVTALAFLTQAAIGEAQVLDAGDAAAESAAKQALEKGVETAVFDRGGYIYHGRVKALAEAAREAGLRI